MEKIQKAIEKARSTREPGSSSSNKTDINGVGEIRYTKTQLINCPLTLQRENRIVSALGKSSYADAFKILSIQVIQRLEENNWKSVAVSGVHSDEGATTTAINLGISIAKEVEYTVLLVDANLQNPCLHKRFGVKPTYGLSDYLKKGIDLSDILIKPDNIDHFVLLPGGEPIANSSEMLASPKMCALVDELKERYPKRIVLFDMPPVTGTADTLAFAPTVDSILLVIEDDVTKEADLKVAVEYLNDCNIIGTVLNKSRY